MPLLPPSRKRSYDIIYSLGCNCSTAGFLNKHYLRNTSGPFDWWAVTPFPEEFDWRIRLICTHFEGFMQKENMEREPLPEGAPEDTLFQNYLDHFGPGFHFPHDFPAGVPFEQAYPKVKAKYERRIARFYQKIQESERVLLVWQSLCQDSCEPNRIKRLCEEACRALGKTVDFLLIWQDDSMSRDQAPVKQELAPNIILWRANIYRKGENNLPLYMGAPELMDPIFRAYALRGAEHVAFWNHTRRCIGRPLGSFLSCFIPVRSWRKRVRSYFKEDRYNKDFNRDLRK